MVEICPECYSKHFPIYEKMKFKISNKKHRCVGCGEMKKIVKEVIINGKVVDIN